MKRKKKEMRERSLVGQVERDKQDEQVGQGISRRGFLRNGGVALGAALAAGSIGLASCTTNASPTGGATGGATGTARIAEGYEVYETDLLIIGSGWGGMAAAFTASEKGVNTILVDKGPYNSSGATGICFDILQGWSYRPQGFQIPAKANTMLNMKLYYNAALEDETVFHMDQWAVNHGDVYVDRNPDGTIRNSHVIDPVSHILTEHAFPRYAKALLESKRFVSIYDRTMLTDFIIQDGQCLGAVGLHLPTGTFRVFRAKATLLHTGDCTWAYGWRTISPDTANSPDSTADLEMAAFRRGAAIGDAEWMDYDLLTCYPTSINCGYAAGLGGDSYNAGHMVDSTGENFLLNSDHSVEEYYADRGLFNRTIAQRIKDGYGSPNGGIYVDYTTSEVRERARYFYTRNIDLFKNVFNIDVDTEPVECLMELQSHGGAPVVDENTMSVDYVGLFCGRGAGIGGEASPAGTHMNAEIGAFAGRSAIKYLETSYKAPGSFDWSGVDAEFERLNGILTQQPDNGLRPVVIRRAIQNVGGKCLGIIRVTEELEEGLAELRRIREEDLPRQTVTDTSRAFNVEWREAIENRNLLDDTELTIRATLERKETRGYYFRPDYPERDNENWFCQLACRLNGEDFVFEKNALPQVDWDAVDWSAVKPNLWFYKDLEEPVSWRLPEGVQE
jgi:succinate dehydrogenase / fumarate reductase flavoprotein subunit